MYIIHSTDAARRVAKYVCILWNICIVVYFYYYITIIIISLSPLNRTVWNAAYSIKTIKTGVYYSIWYTI